MLNYRVQRADIETDQWAVLIHGLFGSLDNLNVLARSLKPTTHCLSIDLPNHGQSPWLEDIGFDQVAEQIAEVLRHEGIKSAHLIGHSLGGKVALHYAITHPEACRSVIAADIAPVAYPSRHSAVFAGLRNVDLSEVNARSDASRMLSEHVKEPPTQQFLLKSLKQSGDNWSWAFNLKGIIDTYPTFIDWPNSTDVFNGPVLFIIGGDSDYVTPAHQQAIQAQYPNASAKIINGTGHWLHAEKPAVFNKIVGDFLQHH
ncbi:alpha/beta fold hydrolase [Alteromonas oceanisediminis]|uniref:alpha/beta fold hydrolase n=1 Tax=Alteromonas oceanisediminis TaxID=2836180 RepID=UPI001BDA6B0C|nr:alpha/beta fold hydrolase [Alteromonas oceanisediminis]MBT0586401.1 alpha/beta fold hydrolase [Alteromonas oceanisediminis]